MKFYKRYLTILKNLQHMYVKWIHFWCQTKKKKTTYNTVLDLVTFNGGGIFFSWQTSLNFFTPILLQNKITLKSFILSSIYAHCHQYTNIELWFIRKDIIRVKNSPSTAQSHHTVSTGQETCAIFSPVWWWFNKSQWCF